MLTVKLTRKQIENDPWYVDGKHSKAIEFAKKLLRKKFSIEEIADLTELSVDDVVKLKK